jgi:hypothetical protein
LAGLDQDLRVVMAGRDAARITGTEPVHGERREA